MPHSLSGQTALITGGARGIGRAIAVELARYGVSVALAARNARELHETVALLQGQGVDALAVVADLAVAADVRQVVDTTLDAYGTIDILVNNAATLTPVGMTWEVDPDEWAYTIHVNLIGVFRLCHTVLPLMMEEGAGRIINISSGAAQGVVPSWSAYSASKAGLEQFTRVLAAEAQPHGVCVNAVRPGLVDTRMQADLRALSVEQFPSVERFRGHHAAGRLRDPAEPAELALWLCSSAARDVTGQVVDIGDAAIRARVARELGRPLLPD